MHPVFKQEFANIKGWFCGTQYVIDHTDLCLILLLAVVKGVKGRILLDKGNFFDSPKLF